MALLQLTNYSKEFHVSLVLTTRPLLRGRDERYSVDSIPYRNPARK